MTNIFVWSSLLQPTTNYLEGAIVTVLPANATELYLSSVPFFYFKKIEIENNKIWFFNTYLIVLCIVSRPGSSLSSDLWRAVKF